MIAWKIITSFGDLTVMGPAALAIVGWLILAGEQRLAVLWGSLFSIGMGVAVLTKLAFIGWGLGIRSLDFTGISGHALRAAAVMPVFCYLVVQRASSGWQLAGILFGFLCAALVGISRLAVHAHSVSEVVSGLLLGGAISVVFLHGAASLKTRVLNSARIACSLALLLVAPYAHPAPTQRWLTHVALYISGHDKPFVRAGWKAGYPRQRQHLES